MRKTHLLLATAASAVLAGGMITAAAASATASTPSGTSAEQSTVRDIGAAQANCKSKAPGRNGNAYVYATYYCHGSPICADDDNDQDYTEGGDCKGANNRSSSVLNKGFSGSLSDVRFYNAPFYNKYSNRPTFCLKDGHYINKLSSTYNNKLSSHKWVNC
ncbi:hypothetical protein H181DRAFT_03846 [Streptomyces sp. WMMB 714]|uniref:hypothetical protein n=1 Tax=Streptomyces sp. WMMB 714 TaxID=1286822 RepID=UPI00069890F7|nr:hypothetical protein [Streptomyces sp. WMMB 714]SCK43759.1 hypothetical protein H181DRAFT_03846 [Streptomyces sp. WMMB 714]